MSTTFISKLLLSIAFSANRLHNSMIWGSFFPQALFIISEIQYISLIFILLYESLLLQNYNDVLLNYVESFFGIVSPISKSFGQDWLVSIFYLWIILLLGSVISYIIKFWDKKRYDQDKLSQFTAFLVQTNKGLVFHFGVICLCNAVREKNYPLDIVILGLFVVMTLILTYFAFTCGTKERNFSTRNSILKFFTALFKFIVVGTYYMLDTYTWSWLGLIISLGFSVLKFKNLAFEYAILNYEESRLAVKLTSVEIFWPLAGFFCRFMDSNVPNMRLSIIYVMLLLTPMAIKAGMLVYDWSLKSCFFKDNRNLLNHYEVIGKYVYMKYLIARAGVLTSSEGLKLKNEFVFYLIKESEKGLNQESFNFFKEILNLFEFGTQRFPKNADLRLIYAEYLLKSGNSIARSFGILNNIIAQDYKTIMKSMDIKAIMESEALKLGEATKINLDIRKVIRADEISKQLTEEIQLYITMYQKFWAEFKFPDVDFDNIYKQSRSLELQAKKIKVSWNEAIEVLEGKVLKYVHLYCFYLTSTRNMPYEAERVLEKVNMKLGYKADSTQKLGFSNNFYGEDTIVMTVLMSGEHKGMVEKCSNNIFSLGWNEFQVKDINIDTLMPALIGEEHKPIFDRYLTAHDEQNFKHSVSFCKDSRGYILPCEFYTVLYPYITGNLKAMCLLKPEKTHKALFLVRDSGQVDGYTSTVKLMFKTPEKIATHIEDYLKLNNFTYDDPISSSYLSASNEPNLSLINKRRGSSQFDSPKSFSENFSQMLKVRKFSSKTRGFFGLIKNLQILTITWTKSEINYIGEVLLTQTPAFGKTYYILEIGNIQENHTAYKEFPSTGKAESVSEVPSERINVNDTDYQGGQMTTLHIPFGCEHGFGAMIAKNQKILLPNVQRRAQNYHTQMTFEEMDSLSSSTRNVPVKSQSVVSNTKSKVEKDIEQLIHQVPNRASIKILLLMGLFVILTFVVTLMTYQIRQKSLMDSVKNNIDVILACTTTQRELSRLSRLVISYYLVGKGIYDDDRFLKSNISNVRQYRHTQIIRRAVAMNTNKNKIRNTLVNLEDNFQRMITSIEFEVIEKDSLISNRLINPFDIITEFYAAALNIANKDPLTVDQYDEDVLFFFHNAFRDVQHSLKTILELLHFNTQELFQTGDEILKIDIYLLVSVSILFIIFFLRTINKFIKERSQFIINFLLLDNSKLQDHLAKLIAQNYKFQINNASHSQKAKSTHNSEIKNADAMAKPRSGRPIAKTKGINKVFIKASILSLGWLLIFYIPFIYETLNGLTKEQEILAMVNDEDLLNTNLFNLDVFLASFYEVLLNASDEIIGMSPEDAMTKYYLEYSSKTFFFQSLETKYKSESMTAYISGNLCEIIGPIPDRVNLTLCQNLGGGALTRGIIGITQIVTNGYLNAINYFKTSEKNLMNAKTAASLSDVIDSEIIFNYMMFPPYLNVLNEIHEYISQSINDFDKKDKSILIPALIIILLESLYIWFITWRSLRRDVNTWRKIFRHIPYQILMTNKMFMALLKSRSVDRIN